MLALSSKLLEVVLPDSATMIGNNAFYNCAKLKDVTLPGNLETIGDGAFEGVTKAKIYIPDSLTEMGEDAFKNCIVAKTCGDDAEWVLDYPTMTATITGTGVIGNNGKNIFGPFEDMVQFVPLRIKLVEDLPIPESVLLHIQQKQRD